LNKIVGCRVSDELYYKIQGLDISSSDFLRDLINNYFLKNKSTLKIDVNRSKDGVNSQQISDESGLILIKDLI
jgi:hypothetical protein